jgi:hypothetical protein
VQKIHIAIFSFLILAWIGICSAANWQTVITFTGSTSQTTDYFKVPTSEWRIKWSYTPTSQWGGSFGLLVYEKGKQYSSGSVNSPNGTATNGITYMHEGASEYYLDIMPAFADYEIIVEYDTTAPIPEYSTIAITIILGLVSMSVIAVRKKLKKPN